MDYIMETFYEIKEVISNAKKGDIWPLLTLPPILLLPISIIGGLISIIMFYIKNGFHFKFSSAVLPVYFNDIMKYLYIILTIITIITILILFFKEASKKLKVLFFTSILFMIFSIALALYFAFAGNKNFTLLFSFMFLFSGILLFYTIYKQDIPQIGTLILHSLIYYALMPLLLLLASNIVPLIVVVIGIIIFCGISSISIGGSGSSSSSYVPEVKKEKSSSTKGKRVIDVPNGLKLYREKGAFTADYIVQDNGLASHKICTQEEFDKNKVTIMQNGKEIKSIGYRN